ncbi:hypothetical protein B7R21_06390 [Subtercola boreus]|uniref:Holin n=1 Tax=Subtercola boreus TaxID=120213 RepID=A0A3E0VXW9_9MICO|nr:hypothetical protein B7R21_06390 [Subtercola boreus]
MRVCSTPGCPTIYDSTESRCPQHTRTADQRRGTATQRGYTGTGHRVFRNQVITRDPICVICHTAQATVADHYPTSKRDLDAQGMDSNDPDHGRGLCKPCHDRSTAQEQPGGWHNTH